MHVLYTIMCMNSINNNNNKNTKKNSHFHADLTFP